MSEVAAKSAGKAPAAEAPQSMRATATRVSERGLAPAQNRGARESILALQKGAGNRAVASLLARRSAPAERLPGSLETLFSAKFGRDLSQVEIHRGEKASEAASGLGANAFAWGNRIFFRRDAFQPGSSSGQALLAHELAHVVQQTRSSGTPAAGRSSSEARAAQASLDHTEGGVPLDAGALAPRGIAADNGVVYEDEDLRASVLATRDEALDTVIDDEAEVATQSNTANTTDIRTGHLEDRARTLRAKLAPARPPKGKKKDKSKPKPVQMPVSSPDLRDASIEDIRAYRRGLLETQLATADSQDKEMLARDIENTSGAIDYASHTFNILTGGINRFGLREHEAAELLTKLIPQYQARAQMLQDEVYAAHKLREETTSWVTGPTHFWGGAWNEIESGDMAMMNFYRGQAAEAMKAGDVDAALAALNQSAWEYEALSERFGGYKEGIQKGGGRMVKMISTTEKISRGVLNVANPAAGFVYGFGQSSLQDEMMVQRGLKDNVDVWGNFTGAARDALIGRISGGASEFAGGATQPFLGSFGSQGVGLLTGVGTASALTGTNPIDVIKDPTNLAVFLIAKGYKPGVASSGGGAPEAGGVTPESGAAPVPDVPASGAEPLPAAPAADVAAPAAQPETGGTSSFEEPLDVAAASQPEAPSPAPDPVAASVAPAPANQAAPPAVDEAAPAGETSTTDATAGEAPVPANETVPPEQRAAARQAELELRAQEARDIQRARSGRDARRRASKQGIAKRKKIGAENLRTEQPDPAFQEHLQADERDAFIESKGRTVPRDTNMHHTRQSSADPGMADVPEHIQPVTREQHMSREHSAHTADVPTAGIHGDVTSPENPVYDPNAEARGEATNVGMRPDSRRLRDSATDAPVPAPGAPAPDVEVTAQPRGRSMEDVLNEQSAGDYADQLDRFLDYLDGHFDDD